jgi:hypothetical protein
MTTKRHVYRVCAVCGKRHGATYGFKLTLQRLGLENWRDDKAVPACVEKLAGTRAATSPLVVALNKLDGEQEERARRQARIQDELRNLCASTRVRPSIVRVLEGRGPKPKGRTL